MDPAIPTPEEFKGMPVQPLGDKQKFHDDLIQGCLAHYDKRGKSCLANERDRVTMSLRQPKVGNFEVENAA
jgi:hypothetical protein